MVEAEKPETETGGTGTSPSSNVVPSGRYTESGAVIWERAKTETDIQREVSEQRVQRYSNGKKISDTGRVEVTVAGEKKWVTPEKALEVSKEQAKIKEAKEKIRKQEELSKTLRTKYEQEIRRRIAEIPKAQKKEVVRQLQKQKEKTIKKEFGGVSIKAEPKKKKSFVQKLYEKSRRTEFKAQKETGVKRQYYSFLSAWYSFIGAYTEPIRHPVKFVKGVVYTFIHPVEALGSLGTELKERPAGVVGRIAGYWAFGKTVSKVAQKGIEKIASTKQPKIEAIKSTKIVRVSIEEGKTVSVLETEAKIKVGKVTYDVSGAGVEVSRDIGGARYLDIGGIKYLLKKGAKIPTKTYKGVQTITGVTKVEDTGFKGVMQFRTSIKLDKSKYAYQTGVTGFLGEVYAYDEIGPRYAYVQFIKTSAKGVTKDLTKTMLKDVKPIEVRIAEAKPTGIGAGLTKKVAQIWEKEYFQTVSKEVLGKKALASFEKIGKDIYKDISKPGIKPTIPPDTSPGLKTVEVPPATPLTQTFQQTAKQFASVVHSKEAGAKAGAIVPKVTGITTLKQAPLFDVETKYLTKFPQAEEQILGPHKTISVLKSDVEKAQRIGLEKILKILPTTKQAQKQKQIIKQAKQQKQIPKQIIKEVQDQAQQQKQITKQVLKQAQQQKQITKQVPAQVQQIKQVSTQITQPIPLITANIFGPSIYPTDKPTIRGELYEAEVRRRGRFMSIGIFESPREAFLKGKIAVLTSAGASLRVRPLDGPQNLFSVASKILPSKIFRRSVKEPGVYIQRREFRISTPGEKREITYRGLAKIRQMGKKKSIFNIFG